MEIDPTVGGLVWVKRGNGSWWPGQIINPDKCTEGFVDSPEPCCMPIKLLGREDTKPEWYNLRKATRVKPFRCGEYDACIEKAKLAAVDPARKKVYYPRREDGIICALEVEKQNSNPAESAPVGSLFFEHSDDDISRLEESNQVKISSSKPMPTPNDSEDEGVKRMKGLDDLGMSTAPATKRKRIQKPHVTEFLKKSNRRRPLSKVLESTPEVLPPVKTELICSSDQSRPKELNRSSSLVVNNSDTIGVECENSSLGKGFELASGSGLVSCKRKDNGTSSVSALPDKVYSRRLLHGSARNLACQKRSMTATGRNCYSSNEEPNESVSTSSGVEEGGKSNWKLKGKRSFKKGDSDDRFWGRSGCKSLNASPSPALPRSSPVRQSRLVTSPRYSSGFVTAGQDGSNARLFNVNVQVNDSSSGGVLFTSLASKTSNISIVGHPIKVEALKKGSSNDIISGSCSETKDTKRKVMGPPKQSKRHNCVSPMKAATTKVRKGGATSAKNMSLACVPVKTVYSRITAAIMDLTRRPMVRPKRVVKPCRRYEDQVFW